MNRHTRVQLPPTITLGELPGTHTEAPILFVGPRKLNPSTDAATFLRIPCLLHTHRNLKISNTCKKIGETIWETCFRVNL